jgi:hypothetical protein
VDNLVQLQDKTGNVEVDGRLMTIDGFALSENPEKHFPALEANFSVTTYLTPPSEGTTAGATTEGPAEPVTSVPAATTTGGAP